MGRAPNPEMARAAATQIVSTLRSAGHLAYFAGGCVRDELLGLHPTDYDVATDAPPKRIRELFPRTAEVGAAFGVVLVHLGGCSVEVATFRTEGPYSDARRPDVVHFSDPPTDAARRDFTINALFLDPLAAKDAPTIEGHVVDYVGGMADLRSRVLRAVGDPDKRLAEDHLRALRAVRFAARLGFALDPATGEAIRRHAAELRGVSRERIGEELRRMLTHPSRAEAVRLLEALGLDSPILGSSRSRDDRSTAAPPPATLAALSDDAVARLAEGLLDAPPGIQYPTALAAWALDRGLDPVPAQIPHIVGVWREALMLSNEERDQFRDVLVGFGVLREEWLTAGVARQRRTAAERWFPQALRLLAAWQRGRQAAATPSLDGSPSADQVEQRARDLDQTPPGLAPLPLVTGDDLVAIGMRPGPRFKGILESVYDAQLEGKVATKADGMELARRLCV